MLGRSGFALLLASSIMLCGCEAFLMGVATPGIIAQKRVNLLNSSYAAAEILAQRAGKQLTMDIPVVVSDLSEIVDRSGKTRIENPKLGRVIGGQVRDRLFQLGYNIVDSVVDSSRGYAEVSGSYEIREGTMFVTLRLHDHRSGRLISDYNYSLPVTYDIKKYMTSNANSMPAMPPLIDK